MSDDGILLSIDSRVAVVSRGPRGPQGPQGEQGAKGDGFRIDNVVATYAALPVDESLGAVYLVQADGKLYTYGEDGWPANGDGAPFVGPKGDKGDKGDTGNTGATGAKGDKGDTGAAGATGPSGAAGPPGEKGDQGDPFVITGTVATYADLPTEDVAVDDVYSVDADGRAYTYTDSGWPAEGSGALFRGPAGPAGPTGDTGPAGAKGDTGSTGPTGAAGPKGDTGSGLAITATVATYADLPSTGVTQGDVYLVLADNLLYTRGASSWPASGSGFSLKGDKGDKGDQGTTSWADLTDRPTVIAAGATKADARSAISAGTSDLTLGTTETTACAGNDSRLSNQRVPTDNSVDDTKIAPNTLPCDVRLTPFADQAARALGSGDYSAGFIVTRDFTATRVLYQFATADASGSSTVELRLNGTQLPSSDVTVSAADQTDSALTDGARDATISQSFVVGDRILPYVTAVPGSPGNGLRVYLFGTWD